jgi:hypothetical protein
VQRLHFPDGGELCVDAGEARVEVLGQVRENVF